MSFLFYLFLFLIFYTYIGYPAMLVLISRSVARPVRKQIFEPFVSVIISAWNEEDVIKQRIENLLKTSYPEEWLEILIGADGSTDRTVEIVRAFDRSNIRIFDFQERRGKMAVLNDLVKEAKGDFLVFTDCRQAFSENAIHNLISNFHDGKVGCVTGELFLNDSGGATSKGVGLYWRYEKMMREAEGKIHSMLGATGAIYAIRKELYTPIPSEVVLDDMWIPLNIVLKGYRAVFDRTAKAYDKTADNPREEYCRKARTLFGNFQIYCRLWKLFIPFFSPVAIQFFSHKFLRAAAPVMLIAIFILNVALADQGVKFSVMMILQVFFYLMAFIGAVWRDEKTGLKRVIRNICFIPYVFCLLNFSAFIGLLRFLMKDQNVQWEKARGVVGKKVSLRHVSN